MHINHFTTHDPAAFRTGGNGRNASRRSIGA